MNILLIKANKTSIEPAYNTSNHITYYPASAFVSLNTYMLNMSSSPSNGGVASPQTQYYYGGSKVVISASANSGYGFVDWYGYGDGNYTGSNESQVITINGNISEIARFGIEVPVEFNESPPIPTPFSVNLNKYTGNTTIDLITGLYYKYSFPISYENANSGIKYVLNSVTSTCGYSGNNQTINASYTDNNCEILANYTKLVSVTISQTSFNGYGSGQISPASGYYKFGSTITINAVPNQNSAFFKWAGTGAGSYSGNNQTQAIKLIGPITETAVFGAKVPVYITSNTIGSKITVGTTNYTTNTTANLVLEATYPLSARSELLNWGTRISFMNYSGTTCQINSNGTVTINQSGCIIKENFQKQYLLLIMESLNSGTPQNTTNYGGLSPGNYTWENVGANVTIGAYQNAGYGFIGFSGKYGSDTYSGYNTYPNSIYPDSASASATYTYSYPPSYSNCQYSNTSSISFRGWASSGKCYASGIGGFGPVISPAQTYTFKSAIVKMTGPIIEVANYNTNNNYVRTGTYNITVNYVYENYTVTDQSHESSSGNGNSGSYSSSYTQTENPVETENGNLNISVNINQPIENWTPPLGSVTDTYATGSDDVSWSYSTNSYDWWGGNSYGGGGGDSMSASYSGVANVTIENLNYMSPYFISVADQIISETQNNLANKYNLKYQQYSGGIWFVASFKLANATVYYNEAPDLQTESASYYYNSYYSNNFGSGSGSENGNSNQNVESSMFVSGYTSPGIS